MSIFENRRWVIIPTTQVPDLDFGQVLESSPDSLRHSVDGLKTFIKYEINIIPQDITHTFIDPETGEERSSVTLAGTYGRPDFLDYDVVTEHTHSEILDILATEEWTTPKTEGAPI